MFNLGSIKSYMGLVMGAGFFLIGGVPLAQELGLLYLFPIDIPMAVYAGLIALAGLTAFFTARSIFEHATSYAMMLTIFGGLLVILGVISVLTELGYADFSFVPASSLMYEALLVVAGAFILGTSFKH